jgi:hypothetical protein
VATGARKTGRGYNHSLSVRLVTGRGSLVTSSTTGLFHKPSKED